MSLPPSRVVFIRCCCVCSCPPHISYLFGVVVCVLAPLTHSIYSDAGIESTESAEQAKSSGLCALHPLLSPPTTHCSSSLSSAIPRAPLPAFRPHSRSARAAAAPSLCSLTVPHVTHYALTRPPLSLPPPVLPPARSAAVTSSLPPPDITLSPPLQLLPPPSP